MTSIRQLIDWEVKTGREQKVQLRVLFDQPDDFTEYVFDGGSLFSDSGEFTGTELKNRLSWHWEKGMFIDRASPIITLPADTKQNAAILKQFATILQTYIDKNDSITGKVDADWQHDGGPRGEGTYLRITIGE